MGGEREVDKELYEKTDNIKRWMKGNLSTLRGGRQSFNLKRWTVVCQHQEMDRRQSFNIKRWEVVCQHQEMDGRLSTSRDGRTVIFKHQEMDGRQSFDIKRWTDGSLSVCTTRARDIARWRSVVANTYFGTSTRLTD